MEEALSGVSSGVASVLAFADGDLSSVRILICLLGSFRLLKHGEPIHLTRSKLQALLCNLAIEKDHSLHRETLLQRLWPNVEPALSGQSLNSLLSALRRATAPYLDGGSPLVVIDKDQYRLHTAQGIEIDIVVFERLVGQAELGFRLGNRIVAAQYYKQAVAAYTGDLCCVEGASDESSLTILRQRLRNLYLSALRHLADDYFTNGDYARCIDTAERMVDSDPCREDAHRALMRCYVMLGERTQAFRQYQLCVQLLKGELDAVPEFATTHLFDQIRLNPECLVEGEGEGEGGIPCSHDSSHVSTPESQPQPQHQPEPEPQLALSNRTAETHQ